MRLLDWNPHLPTATPVSYAPVRRSAKPPSLALLFGGPFDTLCIGPSIILIIRPPHRNSITVKKPPTPHSSPPTRSRSVSRSHFSLWQWAWQWSKTHTSSGGKGENEEHRGKTAGAEETLKWGWKRGDKGKRTNKEKREVWFRVGTLRWEKKCWEIQNIIRRKREAVGEVWAFPAVLRQTLDFVSPAPPFLEHVVSSELHLQVISSPASLHKASL